MSETRLKVYFILLVPHKINSPGRHPFQIIYWLYWLLEFSPHNVLIFYVLLLDRETYLFYSMWPNKLVGWNSMWPSKLSYRVEFLQEHGTLQFLEKIDKVYKHASLLGHIEYPVKKECMHQKSPTIGNYIIHYLKNINFILVIVNSVL